MIPEPLTPLQVDSLYFNGDLNKRWGACLLSHTAESTVLVRPHGSPLYRSNAAPWTPPSAAIEIYPHNDWYNLFFALDPGDAAWDKPGLHVCYINIALPPTLTGGNLRYIDLDLDLGINRDFSYVTYDIDEFRAHAELWDYPAETRRRALATLEDLVGLVERRDALFQIWKRYLPLVPREYIRGTGAALSPDMEGVLPLAVEESRG